MGCNQNIKNKLIGQTFTTKSHGKCKVIGYINSQKVKIKFLKTKTIRFCKANELRNGEVKDPYYPIIENVGYIGVGKYKPITDKKLYNLWATMLQRGYNEAFKEKQPAYKDCTVAERWFNFQNFCEDIVKMKHWNTKGFELDKDLRVLGNKKYSARRCSFVPKRINAAIGNSRGRPNKLLPGVMLYKGKYKAYATNKGKQLNLGVFNSIEEASKRYEEYRIRKMKFMAEKYKDCIHAEVYENLSNYSSFRHKNSPK